MEEMDRRKFLTGAIVAATAGVVGAMKTDKTEASPETIRLMERARAEEELTNTCVRDLERLYATAGTHRNRSDVERFETARKQIFEDFHNGAAREFRLERSPQMEAEGLALVAIQLAAHHGTKSLIFSGVENERRRVSRSLIPR